MRMRAFESVLNDLGLVEDGEGVGRWKETILLTRKRTGRRYSAVPVVVVGPP